MNSPSDRDLRERLQLALSAARAAGEVTLGYYQSDQLLVERKQDDSPVTAADRGSEQLLRERIEAEFPDDAIVGEEFGERAGSSPFRWILDPIDGTKSFVAGVPLYGTLVGVEHDGQGVVGVILMPALQECVYAARGQGAWYVKGQQPPRPARTSSCQRLSDALLLTTEAAAFAQRQAADVYRQLEQTARLTRTWGDCYGYLLVATGRAELMIDPFLHVWDAAALQPVLQEAGGHFVDWQGRPTIHSGEGLGAANSSVLEQALRFTRNHPPPASS